MHGMCFSELAPSALAPVKPAPCALTARSAGALASSSGLTRAVISSGGTRWFHPLAHSLMFIRRTG